MKEVGIIQKFSSHQMDWIFLGTLPPQAGEELLEKTVLVRGYSEPDSGIARFYSLENGIFLHIGDVSNKEASRQIRRQIENTASREQGGAVLGPCKAVFITDVTGTYDNYRVDHPAAGPVVAGETYPSILALARHIDQAYITLKNALARGKFKDRLHPEAVLKCGISFIRVEDLKD